MQHGLPLDEARGRHIEHRIFHQIDGLPRAPVAVGIVHIAAAGKQLRPAPCRAIRRGPSGRKLWRRTHRSRSCPRIPADPPSRNTLPRLLVDTYSPPAGALAKAVTWVALAFSRSTKRSSPVMAKTWPRFPVPASRRPVESKARAYTRSSREAQMRRESRQARSGKSPNRRWRSDPVSGMLLTRAGGAGVRIQHHHAGLRPPRPWARGSVR